MENENLFVSLEEKHEPVTLIGGQRGGGKIFALENMVAYLKAALKEAKLDRYRWKSAALYYADKCASVQKWISVNDRLPKAGQTVLCFLKRCECWVATWNEMDDNLWTDGENWCSESEVTHWMPLPEAPKGEKKNDL